MGTSNTRTPNMGTSETLLKILAIFKCRTLFEPLSLSLLASIILFFRGLKTILNDLYNRFKVRAIMTIDYIFDARRESESVSKSVLHLDIAKFFKRISDVPICDHI